MTNKSKQLGTSWETALVKWFRSKGWIADRLTLAGKEDEGDLYVEDRFGIGFVIEAKNERRMNLSAYVQEAEVEAENWIKHRDPGGTRPPWLVIVKRRNRTAGQAYVVTTLDEFLRQME